MKKIKRRILRRVKLFPVQPHRCNSIILIATMIVAARTAVAPLAGSEDYNGAEKTHSTF
jgi:hypothetical protein